MRVKEIMKTKVISLKGDETVKDALEILFKMRISGLPVIDAKNELVGMFTEKEILKQILPSYMESVGEFVYEEDPKSIVGKFKSLLAVPISKFMREEVVTIDENATLCEVAHLMLHQKVRRIPVLNKDKKVIGIIAREDVVRAYAGQTGWKKG